MKGARKKPAATCKGYALKLVALKDWTGHEISEKLRLKGYTENEIGETLSLLADKGFVDDRKTAASLVRYFEESRLLGASGCRYRLRQKGVSDDIIREMDFPLERELAKAKKLLEKKLAHSTQYQDKDRVKLLYGLLQRKGFEADVIREALRDGLLAASTEALLASESEGPEEGLAKA